MPTQKINDCKNRYSNLLKVKPTKTLLFRSFPCEREAAKLRNQSIDCIQNGQTGNISYMYLKNKRRKTLIGVEILFYASVFLFFSIAYLFGVSLVPHHNLDLKGYLSLTTELVALFVIPIGNIAVNTSNYLRYKNNIYDCETCLHDSFNDNDFQKIRSLGGGQIKALAEFLEQKKLKAPLLYSDSHYNAKYRNKASNQIKDTSELLENDIAFSKLSIS